MTCVIIALMVSCSGPAIKTDSATAARTWTSATSPAAALDLPTPYEIAIRNQPVRQLQYDRNWPFQQAVTDVQIRPLAEPWSVTTYIGPPWFGFGSGLYSPVRSRSRYGKDSTRPAPGISGGSLTGGHPDQRFRLR